MVSVSLSTDQHVVIAGAGIMGLSLALALREAGFAVTVLERGRAMQQASWAAAGMLAVDDPGNAPALLPLARSSRRLYPEFLRRVAALSGHAVPLRTTQTLQGESAGGAGGQVRPELPALRTHGMRFTLLDEASLDPRDLCRALPLAVSAAGVHLREGVALDAVHEHAGGVFAALSNGESLSAQHCVVAAGAWSGLLPLAGFSALPVTPRKGQMIEVTLDSEPLPLVVRTPEVYLVPRGDGRIAVGATVEDTGFDRDTDEAAAGRLWHSAVARWPPLAKGRITAHWAGIRPGLLAGCDDGLPLIGAVGKNLWVATGHFRDGILLAPGTAALLRACLTGEQPEIAASPYAPERLLNCAASKQ